MSEINAVIISDELINAAIPAENPIAGSPDFDLAEFVESVAGQSGHFELSFTDASLTVANLLVVNHNLGLIAAGVRVIDAVGDRVYPDEVDNGINAIVFDFTLFRPLVGNWRISIGA